MRPRLRSRGSWAARALAPFPLLCLTLFALFASTPSQARAAGAAGPCNATVASLDSARQRVDAARPGAVICLRDGSYGSITLGARKQGAAVTLRPVNPGAATLTGADLSGSRLTLEDFQIDGEVTIEPLASHITISHNHIYGGYFAIDAGPTETEPISDTTIVGNKFTGPYGEDALRLNGYHDGPDRDPYGILIEGNEFTGIRENGNHSDCLQSVWGGDHLYFRRNYLHDNHCQGFFVKDQPSPVETIVLEDNLFLRNEAPCEIPASDCGPELTVHIFGPTQGVRVARNTIWTPGDDLPLAFREGPFGQVTIERNVIYRGWTDWTGGFPNYTEREDVVCKWEGMPRLSASSKRTCHPGFRNPKVDDYRLRHGKAGVDWSPTEVRYGPR